MAPPAARARVARRHRGQNAAALSCRSSPWGRDMAPRCMTPAMAAFTPRIVAIDPTAADRAAMAEASVIIRDGDLVAFPTETVYGLGADALKPSALRRIYEVKGRPADQIGTAHVCTPVT